LGRGGDVQRSTVAANEQRGAIEDRAQLSE
jgi:hypothetical protein